MSEAVFAARCARAEPRTTSTHVVCPATRGCNGPFPSYPKREKTKKAEKPFDFSPFACKLYLGITFLTFGKSVFKLIPSVISIKSARNPTKYGNKSFDSELKKANDHCVFKSCSAIPCFLTLNLPGILKMKIAIAAICLLISLVILFVIIDRKVFLSGDDVVAQQNPMTRRNLTTVATLKPVEQQTETEPAETKPVTETKPAETKPVTEEKPASSAIPVVTAEEAEKLNSEAMIFAEKHARKMEFFSKGMSLVSDDRISNTSTITIADRYDVIFQKNGVIKKREELSKKRIPVQWTIDLNTLTGNCDFEKTEDGYRISSPDGVFKIQAPTKYVLNTTTGISFELSCNSPETKVKAGIEESGMFRPGKEYMGELSGIQDDEFINFQISSLDHFDQFRAFLEITGDVTIHSFRIFQKEVKGTTYLEGQITERSELPDPKKSDYPNCRYTAQFEGNVIKAGEACPKELALIVDGFEDFKTLKSDAVKKGDKILCTIIPYDMLSEEEQSIQQADDLNLFALENYYVLAMRKINSYAEGDNEHFPSSGVYFTDNKQEHISIFDQHINPLVSKELQQAQEKAIAEDLEKVNKMLDGYDDDKIKEINASFVQAWKEEKAKDPPGYNRVIVDHNSQILWRKIDNSYFSISPGMSTLIAKSTVSDETVEALVELKKALEANGVHLIVSVIQNREPIVARIINEKFRDIVDYQTYSNIKILLEHGIEAISPSKEAVEHFNEEAFTYNVGADGHPSILIQKNASEILAGRIARYNLPKRLKRELFSLDEVDHKFWGYDPMKCYPDNCDVAPHNPGDRIKVKKPTLQKDYSFTNKNSEILVVGNSFTVSPYSSGGLISWLTYFSETDVSYYEYTMNGPATVFIDNLLLNPEKYLKGKKVAIIQFALSHLLTVRWHNIAKIDRELKLFSTSKLIESFDDIHVSADMSNLYETVRQTKAVIPGGFDVKTEIEPFELARFMPKKTDKTKGVIVVIPACLLYGSVQIVVNSVELSLPSSWDVKKTSYQSLIYKLPPDTTEISVTVKGSPNSYFVLKDIQIWQ